MGIFSQEVRREFIARPDTAKGQILFKWPDTNIRKLTQLTVEQDELAVFFRDGRVQGTIQPGRVTLDSSEIPFLGILVDAASGGNLFRTELYFVWMREQLLKTLRTDVVAHVVTNGWPLLGIAAHTDEIESETIAQVQRNISSYGLQIVRLGNFTITLKPEDEDKLKNFLKDVQYTKLAGGFQQYASGAAMIGAGQGLAQGPGQGGGVNPAFLGVGLGVGGVVAGQLGQTVAAGGQIQVRCPNCHALNAESA